MSQLVYTGVAVLGCLLMIVNIGLHHIDEGFNAFKFIK